MAAAGLVIPTFEDGTEVDSFLERLACYSAVAGTENNKVSILLMGLTAAQYQTLRDLVSPAVPKDVAFDDVKKHLKSHYGKPTNQRLERTQFRTLHRRDAETFNDFHVRLRKAARNCGFGDKLEDNLLEQFISGVNLLPTPTLMHKLVESEDVETLAGAMKSAGTIQLLESERGYCHTETCDRCSC